MSQSPNDEGKSESAEPEAAAPSAELFTGDPPAPADPLETAQAEVEKWKDLSLRTAADLENFRKRTARDMQEARAYANADLLRALLPILDNFETGLEAARAEGEKSMIFQGLSMVRRQLADFLRDQNVEEIPAMGKPFDPNLHEAVSQEPSDKTPEGTVFKVMRRGFKLKDRLLRPAMVVVSSGARKSEPVTAS
jgi:molecular chaperone GrpE